MKTNVLYALGAAILFGASTPLAKLLLGGLPPVLLAGLLYLGSGLGLGIARLVRDKGWKPSDLAKAEWPWLLGAIFFGGIVAPVALLLGLAHTSGSTASLLLNLEAVLTAVIAWLVFKENADRRVVLGMLAIVGGGVVLSWPTGSVGPSDWFGPVAVCAACICWAIDNNLTRKVSASDALFIASSKGLISGVVNVSLAIWMGAVMPDGMALASTMLVGLMGYGVSLVLFVLALRGLGAARTGAYFSTAPFIGAALSLLLFQDSVSMQLMVSAFLMALGVWLHLTEDHAHEHAHTPMGHTHRHSHDTHHQHAHAAGVDTGKPHTHWHEHGAVTHKHPHFPDIHHQHAHS